MQNYDADFSKSLAAFLAASILYESRMEAAEGCWYVNGDPPAPSAAESTADILNAYTQYFPGLVQSVNSQLTPTAQAQLAASQSTALPTAQLNLDLYKALGPEFAAVGNQIDQQNKLNASAADLAVLQGPGKDVAAASQAIREAANPEEEAARRGIQNQISSLVTGLDPNKLSGSERAEAERTINRDAAQGGRLAGGINTVQNAQGFGSALTQKQGAISQILGNSAGAFGAASTKFDPLQGVLGRPSTSAGESQFSTQNANTGSPAFSLGSDFLGATSAASQQRNNINANRRDGLDRFNEVNQSIGSLVGNL